MSENSNDAVVRRRTAIYLVTLAVEVLLYGTALWFLWPWFVRPGLAVPKVSWALCLGLIVVLRVLWWPWRTTTIPEKMTLGGIVNATIYPAVLVIFGWIIHRFI